MGAPVVHGAQNFLGLGLAGTGMDFGRTKLADFGTKFGANFGADFGADLGADFELTLGQLWLDFGPTFGRLWANFGPSLDRLWANFGPTLGCRHPTLLWRRHPTFVG